MDKITCENIESHTKEQIQNENVKNGLARCDNELKEKSVKKWRENHNKEQTHLQEARVKIKSLEDEIASLKERNEVLQKKLDIIRSAF